MKVVVLRNFFSVSLEKELEAGKTADVKEEVALNWVANGNARITDQEYLKDQAAEAAAKVIEDAEAAEKREAANAKRRAAEKKKRAADNKAAKETKPGQIEVKE